MSASFDEFWGGVDAELARYPMAAELRPMPEHSAEHSTTYFVRLTSIGPYRVSGYYSVPKAAGPHPGLLLTPRYGSVNHVPDYWDRERYAVLQLIHRGQRLADQPFAAAYPGLLTLGIEQPSTYVYRGIVADCLRGAEFLAARSEVDRAHLAAQGDDLALLTAARRASLFTTVLTEEMLLYRLPEAAQRSDAYPVEEVNDFLRTRTEARAAMADTLAYFDARKHAPSIRATVMLSLGDDPSWVEPLRSSLARVQTYQLTHRGAEDHDWLDAWLANELGSTPRSRFVERVL